MKLRSFMAVTIGAVMIPFVIAASMGGLLVVKHERHTLERDALGRARATLTTVDAELRGAMASLQALAASRNLAAGDYKAFHEEAVGVMASQTLWLNVTLYSPSFERVTDAALPFGAPASEAVDPDVLARAFRTGAAQVGPVKVSPLIHLPAVRIYVPIQRGPTTDFVLSASLDPSLFLRLLRDQKMPSGWVIALVDQNSHFVARLPPKPVGLAASPTFQQAIARASEGFYEGFTLEGARSYTPYVTSELSGWTIGIAIPANTVEGGVSEFIETLGIGFFTALVAGSLLGWSLVRRMTDPAVELAASARALEHGLAADIAIDTRFDEFAQLQRALQTLSLRTLEREAGQEREQAALRSASLAKDQFIAMLSHELRNPLGALMTAATVLSKVPPTSNAAARARDIIERQASHMVRLIDDLLDVSRVLMGKMHLAPSLLDLAEVVRSVIESWRPAGKLSQHIVTLEVGPVWIRADRARVAQIFSNLLDNALKFTPPGKEILVQVRRESGSAVMLVRDQGVGLKVEDAEQIFQLFAQGSQGLDRAQGGMGIGLALVKQLSELHGGSAHAFSEGEGKGAIFTVHLPIAEEIGEISAPSGAHLLVLPKRILIIDDNNDALEMLRVALEFSGHRVCTAVDGKSGLAANVEFRPEVVLLDIGLPDMSGFEVAAQLRENLHGHKLLIIAVSGYGSAEDIARGREAGIDVHLTKPVEFGKLDAALALAKGGAQNRLNSA